MYAIVNGMTQARVTPSVTLAEVRDLACIPVWSDREPSAAGVLGIGRTLAYGMAERGEIPTIRLGSRVVVPVPALLRMLGEDPGLSQTQDSRAADLHEQPASHTAAGGALTPERR